MLAVQSAMDALRRSTSHNSDQPSILRQPSAEDLDAAHQLVSSARGERISPPRTNEGQQAISPIPPHAQRSTPEAQQQRASIEADDALSVGGFNQMCR
jgi:hypothetical protein